MPVFDIETGPVEDEILLKLLPEFNPSSAVKDPGEFDPDSVKYGRTKDQEKRRRIYDDALAKHNKAIETRKDKIEKARAEHFTKFKEKAALNPMTGQVLAIGSAWGDLASDAILLRQGPSQISGDPAWSEGVGTETQVLCKFWEQFCENEPEPYVGHYVFGFDLPFLVRRSILRQIQIPPEIFRGGKFDQLAYHPWHERWKDTNKIWQFGNREQSEKLDSIAKFFGLGEKPEGIDGGDFARLYTGSKEEHKQAISYLLNDLAMQWRASEYIRVCLYS